MRKDYFMFDEQHRLEHEREVRKIARQHAIAKAVSVAFDAAAIIVILGSLAMIVIGHNEHLTRLFAN